MKRFIVGALILLAGCVAPTTKSVKINPVLAEIEAKKQSEIALRDIIAEERRLSELSHKILTGAVSLCGEKKRNILGLSIWNRQSMKKEWREAAANLYGVSNVVKVSNVISGSPAAKAGMEPGDVLTAIEDWPLPVGDGAVKKAREKLKELLEKNKDSISIYLVQEGKQRTVSVEAVSACDYPAILEPTDIVNAFADGKNIIVTRGMMEFARNDKELSLVLSHELAHNTMKHIDAKQQNALAGAAGGFVIDLIFAALGANTQGQFAELGAKAGAGVYSVEFEQEADYVGLYAMALSNLEIEGAPDFWRRMASKSPESIKFKSTHPTTPERFLALEATVKEIKTKQASGEPLVPDSKEPEKSKTENSLPAAN